MPRDAVIAAAVEIRAAQLALDEALARRDATAVEQHRTKIDALTRQAALAAPTTRDGALRKLVEIAEFAGCVPDDAAKKVTRIIMRVLRELMRYQPRPGDGSILSHAVLHAAPLAQEVQTPAELRVNRRSIEQAIEAGAIVPTSRTASDRARFSAEYVECLKARAAAARALGHKYLMRSIAVPPERPRRNAAQFVEQTLWKRRHLHRRAAP